MGKETLVKETQRTQPQSSSSALATSPYPRKQVLLAFWEISELQKVNAILL